MKKFAIPIENGQLCTHFGHCQQFAIIRVENSTMLPPEYVTPPPHEPGLIPRWLGQQAVTHVIAAGIGQKAISLFNQQHIEVTVGVEAKAPDKLVEDWLSGSLEAGSNSCDH